MLWIILDPSDIQKQSTPHHTFGGWNFFENLRQPKNNWKKLNNNFSFSFDSTVLEGSSWYISLLPSSVAPSKGPFICNAVFRGQLVLCLECWDKDAAFWEHCHDKFLGRWYQRASNYKCLWKRMSPVRTYTLNGKRTFTVQNCQAQNKKIQKEKKLVLFLQQSNLCFLQVGRNTTTCKHWHYWFEIFPGVSWIAGARRQGDVYIQHGACDIDLPSQDMFSHKIYPGSKYKSVNRKIWKHFLKAQGCLCAGSESQRHITVTTIQRLRPYPAKSINRTLKLLPT